MSVGLSDYMKIKPTRLTKRIIKVAVLLSIFTVTILSIKSLEHKSTIIVDNEYTKCYSINCRKVSLPIEKPSPKEIYEIQKKVEYMKGIERRKVELAKIVEEKRLAEIERIRLAELEAKRIAKQKEKEEAKKKQTVSRGQTASVQTYVYEVTAYTAGYESTGKRPGDKWYGLTASGAYVKQGVTIACPKDFAFGTKIEIEGYGMRVCQDTGSKINSGKLDLYMDSLSAAKDFGRQRLQVKIYR